uniref:Integrase catalytic domain-containing protein n=1 Tax=Haemonchus contortus TaxID=6289 RepID=A0A7I4XT07_HAECO
MVCPLNSNTSLQKKIPQMLAHGVCQKTNFKVTHGGQVRSFYGNHRISGLTQCITSTKTPPTSRKKRVVVTSTESDTALSRSAPIIDLTRFSTLFRAKRVTVIALIFLKKLVKTLPTSRMNAIMEKVKVLHEIPADLTAINGSHIRAARRALIRNHQDIYLTTSYRKSMENTLRLVADNENIWCSKGRLGSASLPQGAKNPVFIAPNSPLARLIIDEAHGTYHRGVEHTMATVRTQYWIPKLRQQVRKLVQQCVKCRRFNALPYQYPESTDLPDRRVLRSRPFEHIGLDFFDLPFPSTTEHAKKSYGCIFTCVVTRLIHLEMVHSLSTEDFINALRRFVARRGVSVSITCDNAPTFLLGARILTEGTMQEGNILKAISDKEIQWNYATPYAPWQGGFYERLIKSVKQALYKALRGAQHRTGDHLRTVLTEIEACLNSRPLTYQSATHEEFTSIRPIDFIQKDLVVTLPMELLLAIHPDDPDYLSPPEARALQTRCEVVEALRTSC